jgi:putative intracellular protease/amidase
MEKSLVVYLPEGFADWEGAFLFPELRQAKRPFIFASSTGESVTSIGGMTVVPERAIVEIEPHSIAGLILIGSDGWMDPAQNEKVLDLAMALNKQNNLVAAICGATVALARRGLLDDRTHTSNDLEMLKKLVPTYKGEKYYSKKLAVTDANLITAPGIAPLEFTREIMNHLKLFSPDYRKHWFELYKNAVMPPPEFWSEA